MNVHTFDTKLDFSFYEKIKSDPIDISPLYHKVPEYENMIRLMENNQSPFDTLNQLDIKHLLYSIIHYELINNNDFIFELKLQLQDLQSGQCIQGQVIRMFQLLYAFVFF